MEVVNSTGSDNLDIKDQILIEMFQMLVCRIKLLFEFFGWFIIDYKYVVVYVYSMIGPKRIISGHKILMFFTLKQNHAVLK